MGAVRIAQAQINPTVGDFAANVDKIARWVGLAKDAGADIVTFPELCLCGYPPEDLLLRSGFVQDNRRALERLIPRCTGITAIVGFAEGEPGNVFNAAALIHDARVVNVYRKVELPNYGVFDEKRYFLSGSRCLIFEMNHIRFSVTICEDIWIRGSVTEKWAWENSADVSLNISASPFHAGKLALRRSIASGFAQATGATVFFTNLVGGQDELAFDGASFVISPTGELSARAESFKEDLLVSDVEIDRDQPGDARGRVDQTRAQLHRLTALGPKDRKPIGPSVAPEPERLEAIYGALVLATGDYARKNGFSKVVISLSGGIDSSFTSAIAVDAMGPENVVGVTMPSKYTSDETLRDVGRLAENLGIELLTVPIDRIFQSYTDETEGPFGQGEEGIAMENLQARIRGNILMGVSNRFGRLVLTTGNKSEHGVGYCTLYGDMAGGFAVVKDVPKTLVYELSDYVNRKAGRAIIPESVIRRPPTAELKPDQKDTDSLPPYEVLDPILTAYVEEDKSPAEIVAAGFDPKIVAEVARMVDRNEYKRRQAPPGVKITPKAFGKDRRPPITNAYIDGELNN